MNSDEDYEFVKRRKTFSKQEVIFLVTSRLTIIRVLGYFTALEAWVNKSHPSGEEILDMARATFIMTTEEET